MDSKVIYNYLTRITGGSLAEMTPEEFNRQMSYITNFVKKLLTDKLSETDIDTFVNNLINPETVPDETPSKLDELRAKLTSSIEQIAAMEEQKRLFCSGMAYLTERNILNEETEAICEQLQAMMTRNSYAGRQSTARPLRISWPVQVDRHEDVKDAIAYRAASALLTTPNR